MLRAILSSLAVGLTLCLLDLLLGILALAHHVLALSIQIIWHHRIILMYVGHQLSAPEVLATCHRKLVVILVYTTSFRGFMEITFKVLDAAAVQITIFMKLFHLCLS
jgi:hypothetical protein